MCIRDRATATQPTVQATIGAGRFKKPRAKANSKKLKPIKEDEEIVEVIKPPKHHFQHHNNPSSF